ncbi:hypothetical protein, partial [Nocardia cerradoensis]|uniref:hypothetical protein n=1 Tax=Nocardia cerradoensis TaxID=85688 RepID=UPI001CB9A59F
WRCRNGIRSGPSKRTREPCEWSPGTVCEAAALDATSNAVLDTQDTQPPAIVARVELAQLAWGFDPPQLPATVVINRIGFTAKVPDLRSEATR